MSARVWPSPPKGDHTGVIFDLPSSMRANHNKVESSSENPAPLCTSHMLKFNSCSKGKRQECNNFAGIGWDFCRIPFPWPWMGFVEGHWPYLLSSMENMLMHPNAAYSTHLTLAGLLPSLLGSLWVAYGGLSLWTYRTYLHITTRMPKLRGWLCHSHWLDSVSLCAQNGPLDFT